MLLRQKFGLLALIYVLSLTANVVTATWCIAVYFRSAFTEFETDLSREQHIEQMRTMLRRQKATLSEPAGLMDALREYEAAQQSLTDSQMTLDTRLADGPYAADWAAVKAALADKGAVATERFRRLQAMRSSRAWPPMSDEQSNVFAVLDRRLGHIGVVLSQQRESSVARAAAVQQRVLTILMFNAAAGAVLCGAGLLIVRRWVLRPVGALREATKRIAAGDFAYRIAPQSRDELGHLADEVNQMSATILDMRDKLVEQERLAAAGEMVSRVAHNIRNPLAGIRGLAETTAQLHADDGELVESQQRIIDTVDRFEKWLRDLQQSFSPLALHPQRVRADHLVDGVVTVLRPMSQRRRVQIETAIDPAVGEVCVDTTHLEQALVALLTNAVQASAPGQTVHVAVRPASDPPGGWQVEVRDEGAGIPPEIRDKILLPYFTTKPDGSGLGLAIVNKVMRLHGGRLSVESEVGRGSRFVAVLPAGACDENKHGERADR